MKRRDFLTHSSIITAGIVAGAPAYALATDNYLGKMDDYPTMVNKFDYSFVSNDIKDFDISVDKVTKTISIMAKNPQYPVLHMMAYHRYFQGQLDAESGTETGLCILDEIIQYRTHDLAICMTNGWQIEPNSIASLYGGVFQNELHYATLVFPNTINYKLFRNITFHIGDEKYDLPNTKKFHMIHFMPKDERSGRLFYERLDPRRNKWDGYGYLYQMPIILGTNLIPLGTNNSPEHITS